MPPHHNSIPQDLETDGLNSKTKLHINVVVIGHVDSGKSTTTGRKPPSMPRSSTYKMTHSISQT